MTVLQENMRWPRGSVLSIRVLLVYFLFVFPRATAAPVSSDVTTFLFRNGTDTVSSVSDTVSSGNAGLGASFAETPRVWSLQACIDYARENNLQVHSAKLDLQNSEIQLKTAKASRLPSLSFNSTQGFTNGNKLNDNGEFVTESQYTGTYQIGTSMTLYNGGKINNTIKQQEILQQANSLLVEKAMNDIEISVTAAFLQVLYAMETEQTDSLVLETSSAQMEQGRARYEAGSIRKSEYAQLQAQYETDRYNWVVSKNDLANALLTLKQLLELGIDRQMVVEQPTVEDMDILQELPALGLVYETALSAMPEIKASQLQIQASGYAEKIARSQMIPSLSLSAAVGTGYYTSAQFAFLNQLGNNLNENVNVGISIPIYQRREAKSAIETAKINTLQAQLDLQTQEKNLLVEVEQAYQDAVSAQSRYLAANRNYEASQLSYSLVQEEYDVGGKTLVDVLAEKSNYLSSVEEMLKAKYQAALSIRLLGFYMAKPLSY